MKHDSGNADAQERLQKIREIQTWIDNGAYYYDSGEFDSAEHMFNKALEVFFLKKSYNSIKNPNFSALSMERGLAQETESMPVGPWRHAKCHFGHSGCGQAGSRLNGGIFGDQPDVLRGGLWMILTISSLISRIEGAS